MVTIIKAVFVNKFGKCQLIQLDNIENKLFFFGLF